MDFVIKLTQGIAVGLISWLFPQLNHQPNIEPTPTNQVDQAIVGETTPITLSNQNYQVLTYQLEQPQTSQLINNLDNQVSSNQAYQDYQCRALINGSFYDVDNTPIGWLKINNQTLSEPEVNRTFNGYLLLQPSGIRLRHNLDEANISHSGFQTGPLLIYQNQQRNLNISVDKNARRSFVATTQGNQVIVGMIISEDSALSGPKLSDMPELVQAYAQETGQQIESAINLDGGLASALITPDHQVNELKLVGSYLCFDPNTK